MRSEKSSKTYHSPTNTLAIQRLPSMIHVEFPHVEDRTMDIKGRRPGVGLKVSKIWERPNSQLNRPRPYKIIPTKIWPIAFYNPISALTSYSPPLRHLTIKYGGQNRLSPCWSRGLAYAGSISAASRMRMIKKRRKRFVERDMN